MNKQAKSKAFLRRQSNEKVRLAIEIAFREGTIRGIPLSAYGKKIRSRLKSWARRIQVCGSEVWIRGCPDRHVTRIINDCCHVPLCAFEERRNARRWAARGRALMRALPEGRNGLRWRMLTVSLNKHPDFLTDIRNTLDLRPRIARMLREAGAVAQLWALDVGAEGHAHLHGLIYAPWISRPLVQGWLQAQDCDLTGCKHAPGDRACHGSWVVDIRKAYSPAEVLKYSVSPGAKGNDTDDHADLRLATYAATIGRHRIQGYGLARQGASYEADRAELADIGNICPECGQILVGLEIGRWKHGAYEWTPLDRGG